jgi:hypothetical protein
MKSSMALLALGLLVGISKVGSVYSDTAYGFSIEPPSFPKGEAGNVSRALFFAPAEKGFANNVNIMVQHVSMTAEDYQKTSLDQFKEMGWEVKETQKRKVGDKDALFFDYAGKTNDKNLRWLALAVVAKDRVYLVTCTALAETFDSCEKEFRKCLDSFKLEE